MQQLRRLVNRGNASCMAWERDGVHYISHVTGRHLRRLPVSKVKAEKLAANHDTVFFDRVLSQIDIAQRNNDSRLHYS